MTSNALRMGFHDWYFRLCTGGVPYQAQGLAVAAVLYKVTTNEELAKFVGMDTKGTADKTYNKWKKHLSDNGWVIIKVVTVGRVTTIEVYPAIDSTAVTFTDLKPRPLSKFYGALAVKATGENYETTVETTNEAVIVTAEAVETTEPEVEVTAVSRAPSRPRIETPSGLLKPLETEGKNPLYPPNDGERVKFENGRLQVFNGLEQFWLKEFGDADNLNLALAQAAGYVQENSRKPLEAQVSAQLARMAREKRDKDARYAKAVKTNAKGGSKRMSLEELSAGVDAAYERSFAHVQPKQARLTDER